MKIARYFYAYRALDDFIVLYPVYPLLFVARGLTPFEVSALFVIWSVTAIIAEVPTGVFADRFSRRRLLILGQLIRAVGYILWLIMPTFPGFALGFILWGIGGAFASGTYEALLFDELKKAGHERMFTKIIGRAESFALAGDLIATALASVIILLGFGAVVWLSVSAVLASAAVIALLPEAKQAEKIDEEKYLASLKRGVVESFALPGIRKLILLGGFSAAIYGTIEEYIPIFFQEVGASESVVALLVALTGVVALIASVGAYRFEKYRDTTLTLAVVFGGLCLAGAGYAGGIPGILLVMVYAFLARGLYVIYTAKLQHSITSDLRATITSVFSFVIEIVSIGIYLIFGLVANRSGYGRTIAIIGIGSSVIALLFLGGRKRLLGRRDPSNSPGATSG